jgi:HD-like signal output (HDOD) protein
LLSADQRYTAQISEVIRRDPSLTSRLLRLVNSVYYGLSSPVNNIEEAVFYLGLRQIRQLAMLTPFIEDFQKLAGDVVYPWREFWQHCIGTAIMAREIMSIVHVINDEADYVAGLIHDVGKIIMASVFPRHFAEIHRRTREMQLELREVEIEVLGIDHSELGGIYLENYNLPDFMVEITRYHHRPEDAGRHIPIVCSVNIADMLVRFAKIGWSGNSAIVTANQWVSSPSWQILFPHQSETEQALVRSGLNRTLERLPMILSGLL